MATYKLQYFNAKGVAEVARYMLAVAGQTYEDVRYNFTLPNFEKPEFDADCAAGEFRVNMDRLPILTYNGAKIGQSKTIERFLAKKLGFFGSNDVEEALIDAVTEHVRDIKQKYNDAKAGKSGDEQAAAKAAFIANDLPKWLDKLEHSLEKSGFSVGSKLSLADFTLFHLLREFFDDKDAVVVLVAERPTLAAIVANVEPALKTWLETRPQTAF
eukprot:gene11902-8492_t